MTNDSRQLLMDILSFSLDYLFYIFVKVGKGCGANVTREIF